ncbi:G-type lectin S-receptor-like serine/threonine-protein kinase, partial [Mucuna pruriens]
MVQFFFLYLISMLLSIQGTPTIITPKESIQGNNTLVSAARTFEVGFFDFGNSQGQYFVYRSTLTIGYRHEHNISPRTIVWVANRDAPVKNSTAFLTLTDQGDPVILDGLKGFIVWFSNSSGISEKPVMQLLDSGNLVVKGGDSTGKFWSFDYPGDTFLAGMKLRTNLVTSPYRYLTSWKNAEDPASGEFSYHIDARGFSQLAETVTRLVLNLLGFAQRWIWSQNRGWEAIFTRPMDRCEYYAFCHVNSVCNVTNSPKICACLEGFVPKFHEKWSSLDWTGGCVRRINLSCDGGDGFQKYTGMKLPDTSSWYNELEH